MKIKYYLENFEYIIAKNIFKSIGNIKIKDKKKIHINFLKFILIQKKEILEQILKLF